MPFFARSPHHGQHRATVTICTLLSATIFAIDLLTPREILFDLLYLAVVLLASRLPGRQPPVVAATACSLLTVVPPFFQTTSVTVFEDAVNRALAILALWFSVWLMLAYHRAQAEARVNVDITDHKEAERILTDTPTRLDERVQERTETLVRKQEQLRAMVSELTLAEHRERRRLGSPLGRAGRAPLSNRPRAAVQRRQARWRR